MSYHSQLTQDHENYESYLKYIADLDLSIKDKYELLYIVNAVLCHFIDTAFGVQTDQITFQSIDKANSNSQLVHDTLGHHPQNQLVNVHTSGVEGDSSPTGSNER